jgi:hypothetical protein
VSACAELEWPATAVVASADAVVDVDDEVDVVDPDVVGVLTVPDAVVAVLAVDGTVVVVVVAAVSVADAWLVMAIVAPIAAKPVRLAAPTRRRARRAGCGRRRRRWGWWSMWRA